MADTVRCIRCRKPVDLDGKDYVIVFPSTIRIGTSTSGFYAHVACQREAERPGRAAERRSPEGEGA